MKPNQRMQAHQAADEMLRELLPADIRYVTDVVSCMLIVPKEGVHISVRVMEQQPPFKWHSAVGLNTNEIETESMEEAVLHTVQLVLTHYSGRGEYS